MKTESFEFNGKTIDFEINDKNVMVNATQMASAFNKQARDFLKNDSTQELVVAFLQEDNSPLEKEYTADGRIVKVVHGGRNNGTWIDRRLAIAFSMWLNAKFAVWVCTTIDDILFGSYREDEKNLREIARLQTAIASKKQELERHPLQLELEQLCKEEKKQRKLLDLRKKQRISNFKSLFSDEEMGDKK